MKKPLRILSILMLCSTTACSTAPKNTASSDHPTPQEMVSSAREVSFEMSYSLGGAHGIHQLVGSSVGSPHVATFLDRQVVDEEAVKAEKYKNFVVKIFNFTQIIQRAPSQEHECRSPYSIILKIDEKTYTSKGCRDLGDGSFGNLVREGEFLLYSKK